MVILKAKVVDSTHLELSRPIEANPGRTVLVSIDETSNPDTEQQEWLNISTASLAGAYSNNEPDYSESMVKESNPEYRT